MSFSSEDLNWKAGLLGSGLALESEAARLLVSEGFHVGTGFQFARPEAEPVEDLSVDLRATAFAPFAETDQAVGALTLLLECRYREPNVRWLFLPDPNRSGDVPAFHGHAIRVIDKFSSYSVDTGTAGLFDAELPNCCRGLQLDVATGRATEADPRSGLVQLQYAMPRLLVDDVFSHLTGSTARNVPFAFCPVLLTTAPLLVVREQMGTDDVERSAALEDLATEVPYLMISLGYGPDFQSHCEREFWALRRLERNETLQLVERRRAGHCRSERELPVTMIELLMAADRYWLDRLFRQFVICTTSGLPRLVERIKQTVEATLQSRREL
jgi:hypothetical protein